MDEHKLHILPYVRMHGIDSAMRNRRDDLEEYSNLCGWRYLIKAQLSYEASLVKFARKNSIIAQEISLK